MDGARGEARTAERRPGALTGAARSFWQLADARDASEVHVDSAQSRTIAELNVFARGARRAIVAPADEPFGVARMMESYSEMAEQVVQVFRDLASAERWLGL